jgi:hypothetical protein
MSIPRRFALLAVVWLGIAFPATSQQGREQIIFLPNYAAAQRAAKATGLPVMAVVQGKGSKAPEAFSDRKVVKASKAFLNVVLGAESAVAKKIEGAKAGNILFIDDAGTTVAQIESSASIDEVLKEMAGVTEKARERVLEKFKNSKDAAAQKTVLDSYGRLGAGTSELIALLSVTNLKVRPALASLLTARTAEGADWALLAVMASPDAELRAAVHPVAAAVIKVGKVPPASFWKDASEEERAEALEKWREAAYGKLPPVNKAILDFTFANYGKQVNDGECAMLAVDAFRHAKAKPIQHKDKTYVWGQELKPEDTVFAGDIVQLEDAKFSNGGSAPHHTQIIRRVLSKGQYEVLEQNAGGRRTVGIGQLNVKLLTQGTVVFYRPQPLADKK